jgi:hypothetical protein
MRWQDMEEQQPHLTSLGRKLLIEPGVVLVGTIRKDGTPRISGVEPLIMDDDLWLSMMRTSTKALDLLRDNRLLVHNIITSGDGQDGEFKIRGLAAENTDSQVHERYAEQVEAQLGWKPVPGKFRLFAVDIETVAFLSSKNEEQFSLTWPPGVETIRRQETPTSLLPPEPVQRFLVS